MVWKFIDYNFIELGKWATIQHCTIQKKESFCKNTETHQLWKEPEGTNSKVNYMDYWLYGLLDWRLSFIFDFFCSIFSLWICMYFYYLFSMHLTFYLTYTHMELIKHKETNTKSFLQTTTNNINMKIASSYCISI